MPLANPRPGRHGGGDLSLVPQFRCCGRRRRTSCSATGRASRRALSCRPRRTRCTMTARTSSTRTRSTRSATRACGAWRVRARSTSPRRPPPSTSPSATGSTRGASRLLCHQARDAPATLRVSPGRYFAANVLKGILAHIVVNYDLRLDGDGPRPQPRYISIGVLPPPGGRVLFKRRRTSTVAGGSGR